MAWRTVWPFIVGVSAMALSVPAVAKADASAQTPLDEVIVTAQKREQAATTVGMAITAATDDVLRIRGITSVSDLPRLVPGFTVQESAYNSTSYTLRGVGFFNSDLSTPPAVTVYIDEAPLPHPAMSRLAAFDLERVEVLKGPQGTLFGQNATGGAVNYIAAKPTLAAAAGVDATYGRFNRALAGAFLSGPLTESLAARIAVQARRGDGWQKSITRPGDKLGRIEELQGRATLEWRPHPRFQSRLTLTATHDGSESQAAQFLAPVPVIPALATPGLLAFPVLAKPRAADWTPVRPDTNGPFPYESDTTLLQASWRNDYELNEDVTLTSLTSYAHYRLAYGQDPDGTPFHVDELIDRDGEVSFVFQELRIAGGQGRVRWLLGANYAHDTVTDAPVQYFSDNDVGRLFQQVDPLAFADRSVFTSRVRARTYAAFGRVEFAVTDQLQLEAAARYNDDSRRFENCSYAMTENFTRFWNAFRGGAAPPTRIGDCYVLDSANGLSPVTRVRNALDEDAFSWRAGLNWTARPGLLLFANASKGYKAGASPVLAATTTAQFTPVPQESVLAYEAGVKASLLDLRVQLNASAFYYDYKDKQLRGAVLDPVFGPLEALVSIPESRVFGLEAQVIARPVEGLTIDASATYVDTQVERFTGFDGRANFGDQSGTPFPFSPKWQAVTHVDYEFALAGATKGFLGGSLTYNSKTYSGVGALDLLAINSFTLLDLRAGVTWGEDAYRLWIWGRNVTNAYYWNNVFANGNAVSRFVGQPATYGMSVSARF